MNRSLFFWVGLAILIGQVPLKSWAEEANHAQLAGPAFVEAEENSTVVPPGWVEKGIVHPKEVGKIDLLVSMDQHLFPSAPPIIEAFARSKGLKIVVREGTCGVSAGALMKKEADIVSFCCPPAPTDRLPGLVYHTIGVVANLLLTHPENPTTDVSLAEARALFAGDIRQWDTLNDAAAKSYRRPVHPISRLHCKTRPGHWRPLLDREELFSPDTQNVSTIPDMLDRVAADPNAIGFAAHWLLSDPKNGQRLKYLKVDGVSPDEPDALESGRYPFMNVLNMTTWRGAAANPIAEELVQYILSHLKAFPADGRVVGADRLRAAGWQFRNNEVVGGPGK